MAKDIKIIAIGAGVQDVFLQGKIFRAHKDDDGDLVEEFELGTKNEIENVTLTTGGGGTNAAVTFARQGLHSCYMGRVGRDIAGQAVLDTLHEEGVDTALVDYAKEGTGYSTLLLAPNGERTILTYRGASSNFDFHETDFHGVRADWMYISSLAGDIQTLELILKYAERHDIKVAVNPGKGELAEHATLRQLLPKITLLSTNKEEMAKLFKSDNAAQLATEAAKHVPYVVVTDGPKGSYFCDGKQLYTAGLYKDVPVVDRTGAGDAYSSGLVAMLARGESVERAMSFAAANSTSVVQHIGAKEGILQEDAKFHIMPIQTVRL